MSQHHDWAAPSTQSYSTASYPPTTPGMNAYSSYGQPPASSHSYGSTAYSSHYYNGGQMLSPQSQGHGSSLNSLGGLPGLHNGPPHYSQPPNPAYGPNQGLQDTTGQVAPSGVKPKVTATLWEDEGTICFQVESGGLCVARREDNHFINGTKLLNVAGMTRGRRDGILKSEKTRNVVKIGPMHLKGVWIPFDRALEFANREKITEKLYPLFVHNIGNLIPQGQSGRGSVANLRGSKLGQPGMGHLGHAMVPSLPQHPSMQLPSQIASRPGLDRAQTFPTPPTSASSVVNSGSEYWSQPAMNTSMSHGSQPIHVSNDMNHPRSMPSTPASTPPSHSLQSMSSFSHQGMNPGQQQNGQYGSQYSTPNGYMKNEMGPPTRSNTLPSNETKDIKQDPFTNGTGNHDGPGNDQAAPYGQDGGNFGNGNHSSYAFSGVSSVPQMPSMSNGTSEHMGSAHHDTQTGQITPRASVSHDQWTGYQTPPRTNTYPGYPSAIISGSNKRSRDDDDNSYDGNLDSMKRRKSIRDDMNAPRPGMMAPIGR